MVTEYIRRAISPNLFFIAKPAVLAIVFHPSLNLYAMPVNRLLAFFSTP
jgi:hypothetical protein